MSKFTSIVAFVLFSWGGYAQDGGIVFEEMQWDDVFKKAAAEQKLVFVMGYVDWSEPCALLEEYTLSDQEVATFYNEEFVSVRVDMEGNLGLLLTEMYDVVSYPVFLFLDSEGEMVHRGCGAVDAADFIGLGEVALSDQSLSSMQHTFQSGERSVAFLEKYSFALDYACMDKKSFVSSFFEGTADVDWLQEASWAMINLNVSAPFSEQIQYVIDRQEQFSAKYGKDTVDAKLFNVMLDQLIAIYEGEDLTLFATQALHKMISEVDFAEKEQLMHLANLKINDLQENWPEYAENVVLVVGEQQVRDPDQLNEFGWKFYLFVDDEVQLNAAAKWMKAVVKEYPDATYYDTYASLRYKLGEQKEAVKYGRLALRAAENAVEDLTHYKEQLDMFLSGR